MKKGFTILELLVAAIVVCIVIAMVLTMLHSQNSNMIGIRQRVQAQTSARDGLKIMESELRIAGFTANVSLALVNGRTDSLSGYNATCLAMEDANGSSVSAKDGAAGGNDTLYVAYPMAVSPSTGADCLSTQWSRYNLDAAGELIRTIETSKAGLAASTDSMVVAQNVDVFQVRLGAMGMATPAATFLDPATEACCVTGAAWSTSNAGASTSSGTLTITPWASHSWYVLSATKTTTKGERLRDTFSIVPSAGFFTDLVNGATISAGIYDASGNAVAVKQILTIPAAAKALSALNGGLTFSIDLVDPTGGSRKIGFSGVSKTAPGTIQAKFLNAYRAGAGAGVAWFKDPASMAASDWSRTKAVEVILLSRANSDEASKTTTYTNVLANYKGSAPVSFNDNKLRVLFDHVYPVGNNGGF